MYSSHRPEKVVSVIIPAYNEERTIAGVIRAASGNKRVAEVIVIDDGSSDTTTEVARAAGARVIVQGHNTGKALAMERGVAEAQHNYIFFLDADLIGLTPQIMDCALDPVLEGKVEMFALIVDRGPWVPSLLLNYLPLLSGIRVLKREVWQSVPKEFKKFFKLS